MLLLPAFLASLRTRRAPGCPRCRPRPRALAPLRPRRARDRQAVRRPALGDGCRDRAAGALALPADPAPSTARDRGLGVPRERRTRARRARGARRSRAGSRSRSRSASRRIRRTCSSSAASRPRRGSTSSWRRRQGLPRVIVGAGPVDVPEAVGFVPHAELGPYYERAAVVCVPSRREGYGFVAHEAMAYGRPVVATRGRRARRRRRRPRPTRRRAAAARGAGRTPRGRGLARAPRCCSASERDRQVCRRDRCERAPRGVRRGAGGKLRGEGPLTPSLFCCR